MIEIPHNPISNPRKLPFQSWVYSYHVGYHRTEVAALAAARRKAREAARLSGGNRPDCEVRRVVGISDA